MTDRYDEYDPTIGDDGMHMPPLSGKGRPTTPGRLEVEEAARDILPPAPPRAKPTAQPVPGAGRRRLRHPTAGTYQPAGDPTAAFIRGLALGAVAAALLAAVARRGHAGSSVPGVAP